MASMNMSAELLNAAVLALTYADSNRIAVVEEFGLEGLTNTNGDLINLDEVFEWAREIFEELLAEELGIEI